MKRGMILRVSSLILLCFVWGLFTGVNASAQKRGGILKVAIFSEPRPLDPHNFGDMTGDVLNQYLYENLISMDKNFKVFPCLATSWKMAPDGKSYVFNLRKGVKFHDGAPFNAKAVESNFNRLSKDKDRLRGGKPLDVWFKSAEVIDDDTIRINLKDVYTPFLSEMTKLYTRIISPLAIGKYGAELGKNPSGTGPWRLSKWTPGEGIVFGRNPDYWGEKTLLDEVLFRFTSDQMTRMMAFESQSTDAVFEPQYMDIDRLEKTKKYRSHMEPTSNFMSLQFNTMLKPLDQKEVRHAIAYAINRTAIVNTLFAGKGVVANGYGPPTLPDTLIKQDAFPYNPERAKEILNQLGWKPGPDGILVKDGERFAFSIMTPFGRYPMDKQTAEAVQSYLKAIGIDARVDVVEPAAWVNWLQSEPEKRRGSKVGMLFWGRPLDGSLEFALVQHYHSGYMPKQGHNVSSFSNKEFDRLMESARRITHDHERLQTYRKAQEILFDELPGLPVVYPYCFLFNWPYVHNIEIFVANYSAGVNITPKTWIDK